MVIVFTFDRDGTVDTSNGPVPLEVVVKLKKKYIVYAYGNRLLKDEAKISYAEGATKRDRLEWLREKYHDASEYIVVDDVPIDVEGWKYYKPDEFMKVVDRYLEEEAEKEWE